MKSVRIRSYSTPHFPAFSRIQTDYFSDIFLKYWVSLRIQSECGKMRTRITPNTDTFYAVYLANKMQKNQIFLIDLLTKTIKNTEVEKSNARNIAELLREILNIKLLGENDSWILRCKSWFFYLSNSVASLYCTHKPNGKSIVTRFKISERDSKIHKLGNSAEWRSLKQRVSKHMKGSSKTHSSAVKYIKEQS